MLWRQALLIDDLLMRVSGCMAAGFMAAVRRHRVHMQPCHPLLHGFCSDLSFKRRCCGPAQEADELAGRQRQFADAKARLLNERKGLEMAQEALEASLAEVRNINLSRHLNSIAAQFGSIMACGVSMIYCLAAVVLSSECAACACCRRWE